MGQPIWASDLHPHGSMEALLSDAVKPNLVQSLEGTPAFVHGGPFANIAQGTATPSPRLTALKLADYVVTEPVSALTWGRKISWTSNAAWRT